MARKADGVRVERKVAGGRSEVLRDDVSPSPSQKAVANTVGFSLGITKDQGQYESLRIDAWRTVSLSPGEDHEEAQLRIADDLKKVIEDVYDEFSWGGKKDAGDSGYSRGNTGSGRPGKSRR